MGLWWRVFNQSMRTNCTPPIGGGRILSCLNDKSSNVSAECKAIVAEFKERLGVE